MWRSDAKNIVLWTRTSDRRASGIEIRLRYRRRIRGRAHHIRSPHGVANLRRPARPRGWIEAQGNYVALHADGRSHLVRHTMKSLSTCLDQTFVRIERSAMVRVATIREVREWRRPSGDPTRRLRPESQPPHAESSGLGHGDRGLSTTRGAASRRDAHPVDRPLVTSGLWLTAAPR